MKQLLTACLLLLLFTACQQQNAQSPTAPGYGTGETVSRTKYRIIFLKETDKHGHNAELYLRDFETIVNQAIAEGWQPAGGVTTAGFAAVPMQAMIKTE